MEPDEVRELYNYNAWANHRTLDACAALTEEQFIRDLRSSFRSVRDTIVHILGAEWIWLDRCNGRSPVALPSPEPFVSVSGVRARWGEIERDQLGFVGGLSAADLDRVIEYRNMRGNRFAYPLRRILRHVVNHSTYHRGQVASMLRQLGIAPAATDLLRYYDVLDGNPEE
jgi:uncharacterized damage-inducible protein DinB